MVVRITGHVMIRHSLVDVTMDIKETIVRLKSVIKIALIMVFAKMESVTVIHTSQVMIAHSQLV